MIAMQDTNNALLGHDLAHHYMTVAQMVQAKCEQGEDIRCLICKCFCVFFHSVQTTSIAARGGGGSFKRLKIYNSEEHVPIEIVCVTCFNPSHFEEPILSTCAYRKTAKKEFDRNMHC